MLKKGPTLQDVAREASVSTATVSRTLSAPDSVSAKKREAVMQAIQSTGYRLNRAARNLRTQRSNSVLALLPTLGNPFFSLVLQGIVDELTPAGQALVVAETGQMQHAGEDLITHMEDQRADGVIVLDGSLPRESIERLQSSDHGARVVFACEWPQHGKFPSVRSANEEGARMAVEHLYAQGHRRIAHVTGPKGNVLTDTRCEGYELACRKFQIEPLFIDGDFTLEAGTRAATEILAMEHRPTAVFCAADTIAFGLISRLTHAGVSVPVDLSVVGFDDIEYAEHFVPPLTTIRQDRFALGQAAARSLLQRYGRPGDASRCDIETIPVQLVPRASTAPTVRSGSIQKRVNA